MNTNTKAKETKYKNSNNYCYNVDTLRKSFFVKFLIVIMILGFASVGILDFGSVQASTPLEPNRSLFAPEFTVTLESHPYFESPKYRVDPFTGERETIHNGYHVENKSIIIRIKNTPFTPYYDEFGSFLELFYVFQAKGHFEGSWTQLDSIHVSDSEYSVKYYPIGDETDELFLRQLSVGDTVDFHVKEQLGILDYPPGAYQFGSPSIKYPSSDFSETQTLTFTELPTPTPTTEPFPTTITVASIAIVAVIGIGILVYFKKYRK